MTNTLRNPFISNTPTASPVKGAGRTNDYNNINNVNSATDYSYGTASIPYNNDDSSSVIATTSPYTQTSINGSPNRIIKRSSTTSSLPSCTRSRSRSRSQTRSLLGSPSRLSRTSGSVVYTDRFLPTRTGMNMHSIISLSGSAGGSSLGLDDISGSNNGNGSRNTGSGRYVNGSSTFVNITGSSSSGSSSSTGTGTVASSSSGTESDDQIEKQRERIAMETFDTVLKNEIFGDILARDTIGSETTVDKIKNSYLPATPNASPERARASGSSPSRSAAAVNAVSGMSGYSPRRRLFSPDETLYRPSSNSNRGASLLSYTERTTVSPNRHPTTALLNSQFFDTPSVSPIRPDSRQLLLSPSKKFRKIAKIPYRVLDAPSLADDFYYDLIDWSSQDFLAVGLGNAVFLSNNRTNEVIHLCSSPHDEYTSLSWVSAGTHLAVGHYSGLLEIYDVEKQKRIRTLQGHTDRIACLSWNNHVLSSGSRDHTILHRDVRVPQPFFGCIESAHSQEVCGLKWNVDENKLASGGNDNVVNVFDGCNTKPLLTMTEHKAAVKAMAWSPHKRATLATGGGTADRSLKIWNINTSLKVNEVDTGSQVCNMVWSKNTDELVTSHGYSKYNLTLWDFPSLDPITVLKGHSFRVLHLTLSQDGTTVVSGAGDETLRFWLLFDKPKHRKPRTYSTSLFSSVNKIR